MLTGGSVQDRSDGLGGPVLAEVRALHAQCAELRQTCAQTQQTAALALQRCARVHADCRRARGELVRTELPRDPSCGAVARRLVEEHLATVCADEIADAKTVVSELANNAFLHGKGRIQLRISRRRGLTRIEVLDQGQGQRVQAGEQTGWHGLDIVDALALAWGTRKGRTHVWAELSTHGPAPGRAWTPAKQRQEHTARVKVDAGHVEPEPSGGRSTP